eukprot:947890_1
MSMDTSYKQHHQRHNIRKARQRDPIVSVFMHNNPNRCYSITVPSSKSWQDFIHKIEKQFQLPSDSNITLYQAPLDNDQFNINDLHQYDIHNTNMNKIQHKYKFCAKLPIKQKSIKKNKYKKKNKKNRHNSNNISDIDSSSFNDSIDSTSSSSSSNTSTDSDDNNSEYKNNEILKESSFGIDLDIFNRLCVSKKPQSSKKNSKPVYHFHPTSTIQSLNFHLKNTWLELKTQPMIVKHIDNKYTLMQDKNKQFSLRTRRIIWPRNLQYRKDEFEYTLTDICSKWIWGIIIIHGGKFAGAIYHGNKMILHKTLRRYVTRKKQGKRQVNHLSNSGVKSGSAGGYKRAWNEKKLLIEIREILCNWMEQLISCDKIFIHTPGNYNKQNIFGNNEEQMYLYPQYNNRQLNDKLSKERLNEIRNKKK